MHIVLASTALERGGTWRHIEDLAVELGRRGHDVTVALRPAARELQDAAASAGLRWRPLRSTLRMHADVWHLHLHDTYEPSALSLLALRRPFGAAVVTEHLPRTPGSDPGLAAGAPSRGIGRPARTAFKRAQVALTARTIVPSRGAACFMRDRYGLGADDVVVAHNGVAGMPAIVDAPARRVRGLAVVTLGALVEQKGLDVLLAAASRSRHAWPITIVGDGPLRARLQQTAAGLGPDRVRFAGWADDPSPYLRASDVLCMPSHYESFGYAAAEAGAWGRPTVGSLIDGLDEVVVDGATGILVEAGDPDQLATALDGLWEDPELLVALGRAARERVRERFTIERTADALLAIYASPAQRR
jgi:glycosyltransferase involved in cell wall biosynthesis